MASEGTNVSDRRAFSMGGNSYRAGGNGGGEGEGGGKGGGARRGRR